MRQRSDLSPVWVKPVGGVVAQVGLPRVTIRALHDLDHTKLTSNAVNFSKSLSVISPASTARGSAASARARPLSRWCRPHHLR